MSTRFENLSRFRIILLSLFEYLRVGPKEYSEDNSIFGLIVKLDEIDCYCIAKNLD